MIIFQQSPFQKATIKSNRNISIKNSFVMYRRLHALIQTNIKLLNLKINSIWKMVRKPMLNPYGLLWGVHETMPAKPIGAALLVGRHQVQMWVSLQRASSLCSLMCVTNWTLSMKTWACFPGGGKLFSNNNYDSYHRWIFSIYIGSQIFNKHWKKLLRDSI